MTNRYTDAASNVAERIARLRREAEQANAGPDIGEKRVSREQFRRIFTGASPEVKEKLLREMSPEDQVRLAKELRGRPG